MMPGQCHVTSAEHLSPWRKGFGSARLLRNLAAITVLAASPIAWAGYTVTYLWGTNGSALVDGYADGQHYRTVLKCPQQEPPVPTNGSSLAAIILHGVWVDCQRGIQEEQGSQLLRALGTGSSAVSASTSLSALSARTEMLRVATDGVAALSLASSTPYLPFLGNPLVVIGYAPNSTVAANVTANYSVALRRQSNCSLNEDFILPGATTPDTPNGDFIASLPGAQDYFHQLAGLTTTADIFAQGCGYPGLGQPSIASAGLLLQPTANGGSIDASLSSSLQVTVADPVANTFTTSTLLSSSANPSLSAVTSAKLTGSGNVDLVATFATDPVTRQLATAILLSNGNGTFKSAAYYDIAGDVTVDDMNGDGIPDIVICGVTPGITTLIGKGDGTFTPGALSAATIGACGGAAGVILTGDFNGDGKQDLLVNGVVLLGAGDGTFTVGSPVTTAPLNFSSSIAAVAVGDVNKDGKADVVVSQPGFVALFYGNGDGTFQVGPHYAALPDYMQVSITDIDGDGNPDIVLGGGSAGIYTDGCCNDLTTPPLFQILMGRGDGTFVDSVAYSQGHYGNGLYSVAGPQIAAADFNGDGKPDALVIGSGLSMLPGDGTGKLGTPVTSPVNVSPKMLVTADMNKDGKLDVVMGTNSGVSVLLNIGNGAFAGEQDYTLPSAAVSLATGDFNGDGFMDVAVGVNPGSTGVYVLFGQANGMYAAPAKVDSSLNPTGLAAADINGDGRADLVVADQGFFNYAGASNQVNGAVHVYFGNANGSFTAGASPTTSATNYSIAALGDLNGDGKLDLILGGNIAGGQDTSTPSAYTLLGNGDGTFKAASATALIGNYGIGTTAISLADFNHDGHLDVVVGDATAFTSVLLGNGDGTLTPTMLTLGQQPLALAAADLNADGFPELLVGTSDTYGNANLSVFLNANAWAAAVTAPASTTALSSSATTIAPGQSLALTATVAATSGSTVPTGTVTFLDGSTVLGTGTLGSDGTATFTTTTLAVGSHLLSASYGGSSSFAGSTSSAITVTVGAGGPDFTTTLSPTSGSVARGQSSTTVIALTPVNGFNQTVSLSCSGLPVGASCSFSAASVAVNGSAATSTLTISTTTATAMNTPRNPFDPLAPSGILFAGIGLPVLFRRRKAVALWLRSAALTLLIVGAGTLLQGCGGGGGGSSGSSGGSTGTPVGTYTVTVTATAGSTTHSATYALTVN